jgi:hypothetical protein
MTAKIPATSEEQIAQLGKIRRIPTQIDLLTGDLVVNPPKRGDGSHIKLKPAGFEKPIVPGMASYAGEGPEGKHCNDCAFFGEVAVLRPDAKETVEMNREGCVKFASRSGHASPGYKTNIRYCSACSLFEERVRAISRFVVNMDGEVIPLDQFPQMNFHTWALKRKGT